MNNTIAVFCCLAAVAIASTASAQTLALGDSIGIDFASPGVVFGNDSSVAPAAGTNFNAFDTATEDMATASFSGTLITLTGGTTGIGFSVTNNTGKASSLTGVSGTPGPAPFDDETIGVDNYGAANVGNPDRADFGPLLGSIDEDGNAVDEVDEDGNFVAPAANMVFSFSGLDDSLAYEVTGGYLHSTPNDNFNTTWDIDGQSATTANTSEMPDAGYVTLTNLSTDGAGNLEITVTRGIQLFVSGLTVTAVEPTADCILADVDQNGMVDFFDIQPFIDVLSGMEEFRCEADIDGDGEVTFFDIQPFIDILSGNG